MTVNVKICGLRTADSIDVSVKAGADMLGFNSFMKSPRFVAPDQAAALCARVPEGIAKVGLFVDPDDAMLAVYLENARFDIIQLHGHENPARAAEIRTRFNTPVMKVIGIADTNDLASTSAYREAADHLLLDTKPPKGADRPGGNAMAFDWTILKGWKAPMPWMLAGGLTPDNVGEAVAISGAPGVDVASGVESEPGRKDADLIRAFITNARAGYTGRDGSLEDDGLPKLVL